jgi:hypothetical protein
VPRLLALLLATAALAAAVASSPPADAAGRWRSAHVTAYSTRENLTGCRGYFRSGERACGTACPSPWGYLHDWQRTVAANPRLGLRCGARIVVCGTRCSRATVTDSTASGFDMEFSYALAVATGAPRGAGWDAPRYVRWRPG